MPLQNLRADEPSGLIGATLPAIQQGSDLFSFFHFAPTGKQDALPGQTTSEFKPTGGAFHALATLYVTTDAEGIIQIVRLVVARSFIDEQKTCIYAADLAKSYLLDAGGPEGGGAITALAREIDARSMTNPGITILSAHLAPGAGGKPSSAYKTYAGKNEKKTLTNGAGLIQLLLQNRSEKGTPVLELTVSAGPKSAI